MNEIKWPDGYVPGFTDNFASNEIIVAGLSVADVWPWLDDPTLWPTYYRNATDIRFYDNHAPRLAANVRFRFMTFGFSVEAQVTEYVPPAPGQPARVAWHGWVEGDENSRLDVHHAWLVEELVGGRVRVLTQETQTGVPAKQLAATRPNPMINGHQEWLDGLIASASGARRAERHLEK
jgi:hypothetical protein